MKKDLNQEILSFVHDVQNPLCVIGIISSIIDKAENKQEQIELLKTAARKIQLLTKDIADKILKGIK